MVKALGFGFGLLLFYVALHTLPVQWLLAILIMSGCVTLALMPKPERDPRRWLPQDQPDDDEPLPVWSMDDWTMQDERELAAERQWEDELVEDQWQD